MSELWTQLRFWKQLSILDDDEAFSRPEDALFHSTCPWNTDKRRHPARWSGLPHSLLGLFIINLSRQTPSNMAIPWIVTNYYGGRSDFKHQMDDDWQSHGYMMGGSPNTNPSKNNRLT